MAKTSVALSLIAAGVLGVLALSGTAAAQQAPSVADGGASIDFPNGIVFSMTAESDSIIEDVRLRYRILPDGTAAIGRPEFEPATSVDATFELAGNNPPQIYLSPGTVVAYFWEVTDADGDVAMTEEASLIYDDTRFEWRPVEGHNVVIRYYSGSEEDAEEMHAAAVETMSMMSELLNTEVDFLVHVWLYDSTEDMRPALQARSETYDSQITTLGVRVASNTVLVLNSEDALDTLRHELTHVVTARAGESALGALPAWLDEGTAVYGQEDPGGFGRAIEEALERAEVFSVREISSYPGDPGKVTLFYGQSWSLVSYLIETYGEEEFAALFAEVHAGKRIESALEATYGFGQDGLEDEWRAANDLPPRPTAAPDVGENPPASIENDSGGATTTAIWLAIGVITLAAVVGGLGVLMARRVR